VSKIHQRDLVFLLSKSNNGNKIRIEDVKKIDENIFIKVKQGNSYLGTYTLKDVKVKFR